MVRQKEELNKNILRWFSLFEQDVVAGRGMWKGWKWTLDEFGELLNDGIVKAFCWTVAPWLLWMFFSNLSMESSFCSLSRWVWYKGTLCNQISWYKSDFHILGLLRGSQGKQNRESVAFSPSCPISWPSGSCDWWKQVARRGGDPGHNHSVWRSGNHWGGEEEGEGNCEGAPPHQVTTSLWRRRDAPLTLKRRLEAHHSETHWPELLDVLMPAWKNLRYLIHEQGPQHHQWYNKHTRHKKWRPQCCCYAACLKHWTFTTAEENLSHKEVAAISL